MGTTPAVTAGSLTYLNTGAMIGTSQGSGSWSYFKNNDHTCNFVNNNNPGGGKPNNENAYILIRLPYYLEIKEIYHMGD